MRPSQRLAGAAVVWCACLLGLSAQAHASGFAPPQGSVWTKLSFSRWFADKKLAGPFDRDPSAGIELGSPIEFDPSTGGALTTESFNFDLQATPLPRLSLGLFFPAFQSVTFEDSTFVSTTTGTGDARLFAGYQVTEPGGAVATTINLRVKVPTTTPKRGFEFIPLSEGQWDIALEQVTTWAASPALHVTGRTLIRHRRPFEDDTGPAELRRVLKPGDEAELGFEVGGAPVEGLWMKVAYNGLWSTGAEDRSGTTTITLRDRRQVHTALVGAYLGFGRWVHPALEGLALDVWASHPFTGQDYPFGLTWSAGLAYAVVLGGQSAP